MRHKRIGRKLGVTTKHRKSMLRNMVTDLFRNDSLKTTDTRAKEIRRVAEKMITMAKQGTLHKRRQAGAYIRDNEVLRKLFEELAERFKDRPGGYTRITKLGFRRGDNTPISIIELVEEEYKPKKKKKAKAAPKKQKPKATAKAGSAKVKSSKKESAEELGLIDEEEKKTPEVLAAEAAAVTETIEVSEEETEPKAMAEEEPPAEPKETPETEESSDAPEAKAQEVSEEAEAKPEEQVKAKAEESSEEQAEDNSEVEEDKETEKEEDE